MQTLLDEIRTISKSDDRRAHRARRIAAVIKAAAEYRWVGIYEVSSDWVSVIAWSGPGAPAHPTFPITQGLTSAAIRERKTIVVNDVSLDDRYLTAFGSTRSEIIIPVIEPTDGRVVGTIDVESEQVNAFSADDQKLLENCTAAALSLWI